MEIKEKLQLGDYVLCPVNRHLLWGNKEIALEPKVYDVLCYLLQHYDRFVSLDELHQQVWAGRIVSDTAVRRTISKLRVALDDQAEPARYIQSAAKRGYRWIMTPQAVSAVTPQSQAATTTPLAKPGEYHPADLATDELSPSTIDSTTVIASDSAINNPINSASGSSPASATVVATHNAAHPPAQQVSSDTTLSAVVAHTALTSGATADMSTGTDGTRQIPEKAPRSRHLSRWIWSLLLILGLFMVGVWYWQQQQSWQLGNALVSMHGQKLSLDPHPKRAVVVFAAVPQSTQHFAVFWQDLSSGVVRQLTASSGDVMQVRFNHDGSAIYFHELKNKQYQLFKQSINDKGELIGEPTPIGPPYATMFDIERIPHSQDMVISAGSDSDLKLYRLTAAGEWLPISYSSSAKVQDYMAKVSPDGQQVVFVRRVADQPQLLMIQDLATGSVRKQSLYKEFLYDIEWPSAQQILLLGSRELQLWQPQQDSFHTLQQDLMLADPSLGGISRSIAMLNIDDKPSWLQLMIKQNTGIFSFANGPVGKLTQRRRLYTGAHTAALWFTDEPNSYYQLEHSIEWSRLSKLQADGGVQVLLEKPYGELAVANVHAKTQQLVLRVSGKFYVYSAKDGQLKSLNLHDQHWSAARFSADGRQLVLSRQENGTLQSWLYDLDKGTLHFIAADYEWMLPYGKGYLALNRQKQLVMVINDIAEPLGVQIEGRFGNMFHLRGDELWWIESELYEQSLHRLQIPSRQHDRWQEQGRDLFQRFDVNIAGTEWMLMNVVPIDTEIREVKFK